MSITGNDLETGRKSGISTSAVQVTDTQLKCINGLQVKADPNNAGVIYLGLRSTITADSADATDGYPLAAGESVLVPARSPSDVYVIGSAATQACFWMVA